MEILFYILIFFLSVIMIILLSSLYLSLTKKFECFDNKENYSKIIPNLYIGNIVASQDFSFIKKNNIKVIINCSNTIPNQFVLNSDIEYYRLPVDDSLEEYDIDLMAKLLPQYVEIINKSLTENKPVLVHCYAGRQRSAALIAAYLMYKYNYTIDEAYKLIISKRPQAFHYGKGFNFNKSLLEYQNNLLKV